MRAKTIARDRVVKAFAKALVRLTRRNKFRENKNAVPPVDSTLGELRGSQSGLEGEYQTNLEADDSLSPREIEENTPLSQALDTEDGEESKPKPKPKPKPKVATPTPPEQKANLKPIPQLKPIPKVESEPNLELETKLQVGTLTLTLTLIILTPNPYPK